MLRTSGEKQQVSYDYPCQILEALRERAGFSRAEMQRALEFKSPSAYPRYEDPNRMHDRLIPAELASKLIPLLVGRGMPPVTYDEIIAISEAKELRGLSQSDGGTPRPAPTSGQLRPATFTASVLSNNVSLRVRVRAERGVFVEDDITGKDYGNGPLMASSDFPVEAQFCVAVLDDHATAFGYPRGTALHCCFPDQFGVGALKGKKVLLWLQRDATGLGEMVVTRFKQQPALGNDNSWICEDALGKDVRGRPVGVVVGSLRRE